MNKIYQGNCLEVLQTLEDGVIDVGITSPPYNKQEKHKGWLVQNVKYNAYKDVKTEDAYQQKQIDVLNEIYRITKEGGSFFYNHKLRWERGEMYHPVSWLAKTKWTLKQEIIWDRMIAANIRGWRFWQVDERIYWLYKPITSNITQASKTLRSSKNNKIGAELASKHALLTSIWRFSPERENPHPAPFPITLPTRIIASILDDNDGIVLDPYCGSGTTLVAAKLLNKKYIGIDISENYINYATERLENCNNERALVNDELKKHFVQKTFKQRKENGEFTGRHKTNYNIAIDEQLEM